jgi:hypothetical protein
MEWIVKIEGKPNQRILVRFDAMNELMKFIGQYKPHNKEWVNFSEEIKPVWDSNKIVETPTKDLYKLELELINVDIIQSTLLHTYEKLKKRVEAYEEIDEGFTLIKLIEFKEE